MSDKKISKKPDLPAAKSSTATESPNHPSAQEEVVKEMRIKIPNQTSQEVQHVQTLKGEVMTSQEITPETVQEVSDYYRWIFGNTMQFAVCPPCESHGQNALLTARQAFESKAPIPLDQMDSAQMPTCPCCQKEMQAVYDPETLRDNFRQKLTESDESFLSVLRKADNSLAGLGFAYVTNLTRELRLEWSSKHLYIKKELQKPEYQRSLEHFLACANQVFPGNSFDGSETVLAWNCMSISPEAKGGLMLLMRNLFNKMPNEVKNLRVLGEVKKGSYAHGIFLTVGGCDGTIFFEKADNILIGGSVRKVLETFNLSLEQFKALKKNLIKK